MGRKKQQLLRSVICFVIHPLVSFVVGREMETDCLGQLLLLSLVSFGRRGENGDCQVWVVFVTSICILCSDRGENYFVTSSIGILLVGREMKNVVVTLIGILR